MAAAQLGGLIIRIATYILKNFWGVILIIIFSGLDIFIAIYLHVDTNAELRSIPQLIVIWGTPISVFLFCIWFIWILTKFMKNSALKVLKIILIILSVLTTLACLVIFPFAFVIGGWAYEPEHTVNRYGIKMIARDSSYLDMTMDYYEYKNFIFCGKKSLGREWYGSGGSVDFKNGKPVGKPRTWSFYDLDGNYLDSDTQKNDKWEGSWNNN